MEGERNLNVVVTGGAGFIGSNFLRMSVRRFPEHNFVNVDKLTYAANPENLADCEALPNYSLRAIDITDSAAVEALFAELRPRLVIHFAAESHVDRSIAGPGAFVQANVVGTFELLDAFRRHSADLDGALFHHVSTDEVYGSLGDTGQFTEETRYDPSSPYSASKAASDHLVRSWSRTFGIPVRITNCSNNYGPYQFPEKLVPLMILNAVSGQELPIYGQGRNVRDWLYVEDHCEGIWAAIEKGRPGETYNIGGGCELANIDVVSRICDVVAEETGTDRGRLEELVIFVADRPGHDLRYAVDASKIRRECGWSPAHSFEAGLQATVRWYLENTAWVDRVRSGDYRKWIEINYAGR